LALVALLAGPAPVQAAGGGVKIDLRIHGGTIYLKAGDVNTGSGGFYEFYRTIHELAPKYAFEGDYDPLQFGVDVGFDFVFLLGPRFGIGVGAGYLRAAGEAAWTFTWDTSPTAFMDRPILSAMPIRLGLFYSLPLAGRLSLTANAGASFYAGLRFHDRYRYDQGAFFGEQTISASRWSLSDNLGFQGGLELDYRIGPHWGLFIEAQGRYADFKNFGRATVRVASSEGGSQTRQGKIYLITQILSQDPPISFSAFQVNDVAPTPDPPDHLVREPKFDMSGFCLQAGIRIRL
jgi:hypothetical protein